MVTHIQASRPEGSVSYGVRVELESCKLEDKYLQLALKNRLHFNIQGNIHIVPEPKPAARSSSSSSSSAECKWELVQNSTMEMAPTKQESGKIIRINVSLAKLLQEDGSMDRLREAKRHERKRQRERGKTRHEQQGQQQ